MKKAVTGPRVLHVGNLANYSYKLVKSLRLEGVEADLYMNKNAPRLSQPSSVGSVVPSWVHFWKSKNLLASFFEIISFTKRYDILHGYYTAVIPLQFSGKPYVFHAMGSDLREDAMKPVKGILMRRALRRAYVCLCCQADHLSWYEKIGIKPRISYQPIDTKFYSSKKSPPTKATGLRVFHPSQHDWTHKRNDMFFQAFARFLKENPSATCVCISSGVDFDKSKKLVKELRIEKAVKWLPILNSVQIRNEYVKSDVIADEYVVGSFGLITLEALSCARPVISYYDKALTNRFYKDQPPALWAQTEEDILRQLNEVKNPSFRKKIGKKSRDWLVKNHDSASVTKDLKKLYNEIISKQKK